MSDVVFVDGQMRVKETQDEHPNEKRVDKALYIILAVFLGNFGVHHFYAGKKKRGFYISSSVGHWFRNPGSVRCDQSVWKMKDPKINLDLTQVNAKTQFFND